jgi:hypothetical protein
MTTLFMLLKQFQCQFDVFRFVCFKILQFNNLSFLFWALFGILSLQRSLAVHYLYTTLVSFYLLFDFFDHLYQLCQ